MIYNDTTVNELSIILERSGSVDIYVEHSVEDHTEDENEEEDSVNDLEPVEGHTDDDNKELIFIRKKLKAHMERLRKLKEGASKDNSSIDSDYHVEDDQSDDGNYDVVTKTDVGCEGVQEESGQACQEENIDEARDECVTGERSYIYSYSRRGSNAQTLEQLMQEMDNFSDPGIRDIRDKLVEEHQDVHSDYIASLDPRGYDDTDSDGNHVQRRRST
uniref:Uncharacterized protein LOC105051709 n=1 Tax=Elaeis guineensis var. tenera TaxID=51953 RepID=A0A6I9RQ51_ELAGV|nr:uncharacterized protein LOC105051709 [Elaeis guineensis]